MRLPDKWRVVVLVCVQPVRFSYQRPLDHGRGDSQPCHIHRAGRIILSLENQPRIEHFEIARDRVPRHRLAKTA